MLQTPTDQKLVDDHKGRRLKARCQHTNECGLIAYGFRRCFVDEKRGEKRREINVGQLTLPVCYHRLSNFPQHTSYPLHPTKTNPTENPTKATPTKI